MNILVWINDMMSDEYGKLIVWLGFICVLMIVDVVLGFSRAFVSDELQSSKISDGLIKKFVLLLVLIIIVPLTFLLPEYISISMIIGVYILETINELVSILENLNKLGIATSMFGPIMKRLNDSNKDKNKDEDVQK